MQGKPNTYPPSRTESRTVRCPKCNAEPGWPCMGVRVKIREASHMERMHAAYIVLRGG